MDSRKVLRSLSTPVTLLILLGLLGAGVWWGYKTITAKVATTPPPACVTQTMAELLPASVTVNVYNGGDIRGLASDIANNLGTAGFVIGKVDNTEERVVNIVVIGAATDNPEVQLVAGRFINPEIRADARPDHTVDVLVGNAFASATDLNPAPPASLPLATGQVCLPASATPTPAAGADTTQPTDQAT